jgi:O-methyltransferase domain
VFEEVYSDPDRLGELLRAMSGLQARNFELLAEQFDFSDYTTLTDAVGALALLSRTLAPKHPHMQFNSFDLPPVALHAQEAIDAAGLQDRICVVSGDFMRDALPKADVVTMGNILHDWNSVFHDSIRSRLQARPAPPLPTSRSGGTTALPGRIDLASQSSPRREGPAGTQEIPAWGPLRVDRIYGCRGNCFIHITP